MKKVTWLRTLVTVVLSVTVVSMIYVFTKGWPLMRPPRMEDIKEVTMTDTESGIKKEFVDEENKELAVKLINFFHCPLLIARSFLQSLPKRKPPSSNYQRFQHPLIDDHYHLRKPPYCLRIFLFQYHRPKHR